MLKNSPDQLAIGHSTGGGAAVALRTAFGDLPSLYGGALGEGYFNANIPFPESSDTDEEGGILGLAEQLVYEPVSRIIAGGFSSGRPASVAVLP